MQEDFAMKRVCHLNNVESKCIELDKSQWLNSIPIRTQTKNI